MIVTISRIQHRMGLQEDLPQLAPGELGWSIDSRRLFIGNGLVENGAPPAYTDPNNTEIITEHSIASLIGSFPLYQYKGNGTITLLTGVDALNPVYRTIQDRLDDYVSVKAFGAVGDGYEDDTDAINRALYELYVHDNTIFNKQVLFFPAGIYKLTSDRIKLPTNARLAGDGIDNTIIRQANSSKDSVITLADSKQQVGVAIGTNGANYPGNNHISNLTLEQFEKTKDIVKMDMATDVTFEEVKFRNVWTTGDGGAVGAQAVDIVSTDSNYLSKNIKFDNCVFTGIEYVNKLDYDTVNVLFNNCQFYMCYNVASVGENLLANGQTRVAYGYRIINSYFDKIFSTAIKTFDSVESVISANNYFYDVGNSNTGAYSYDYPIIIFTGDNNASVSDYSERPDTSEVSKQLDFANGRSIGLSANNGLTLNKWNSNLSESLSLSNNVSGVTTNIIKSYSYVPIMKINYKIIRDGNIRFGELFVTAGSGGLSIADDFNEPGTSVGVTFSVASLGGTDYEVQYTTTNTGFTATMEYQINSMR